MVESRAREKFVPRHLTHYLSISIWPASSKAKKAFGRLYRFFFSFLCVLCWEKVQKHKRRQVLYVFNLIFSKWKLTEKSTRQPAPFEFGQNLFFLFFQCQGLRVIFVWQHSLFEFEGLFQLGVYNLIIVIQTLRNKAMNRGTFWKGVWVVFIMFFFHFQAEVFFCACWKRQRQTYEGLNASDRHANCYSRASKACCNARNWECRCKRVQTNSSIMCGSFCFFVFFCNFSVVFRFCGNFSQFPLFELGGNGRQALPDKSFSVGHVEECSMRTFYM